MAIPNKIASYNKNDNFFIFDFNKILSQINFFIFTFRFRICCCEFFSDEIKSEKLPKKISAIFLAVISINREPT